MTADRWTRMVRQQVGLGRFLPLGGPYDGAWIAERAASGALREAAEREVPEVRLDGVRLGLADPDTAADPPVPPPPSALPPGPLRLTAEFATTAAWPLPETASRLRTALAVAATERLGLDVAEVDLRVTELLDEEPGAGRGGTAGTPEGADEPGVAQTPDGPHGSGAAGTPGGATGTGAAGTPGGATGTGAARAPGVVGAPGAADTPEGAGAPDAARVAGPSGGAGARDTAHAFGSDAAAGAADDRGAGSQGERVADVVLGVPGVSRLTGVWGRAVRLGEQGAGVGDALPRRHARVDLAVAAGFRPLEVARAVRAAVAEALPDRPTVAVLVTDLD
ncbi:hypothetical protein ABZ473_06930 [Streptomyces cellulosae]